MRQSQFLKNLIISLTIHALLVLMAFFLPELFPAQQRQTVELSIVETPTRPADSVAKKAMDLPMEAKQVVEQDQKPLNNEKSKDAKFLSSHDQVVKKETVAKNIGEFKNMKDGANLSGDGGSPASLKQMDLRPKMDFTKLVDKKTQEEHELEKSMEEDAIKAQKRDRLIETAAQTPGHGGAPASQTNDYLKDVDQGMQTMLSTREFVFYSFYARIRRQLNQHWSGKVREKVAKIFKEGRSIATSEDKITKLLITLNRQGQLVRVQIINDSGVRDLDDAAIESFKEAAPFPNPPQGIVDPDGTIKIRWDFILAA